MPKILREIYAVYQTRCLKFAIIENRQDFRILEMCKIKKLDINKQQLSQNETYYSKGYKEVLNSY